MWRFAPEFLQGQALAERLGMHMEFYQQAVWPLALRLVHWALALSVIVLIATGWLLGGGMVMNPALHEMLRGTLHVPAGQIAAAALAGRLVLLAVDPGVSGWRALVPRSRDRAARSEMLRFYLSWGRRQPPGYYAHDPVWTLFYPVLFVLLGFQVFTGFAVQSQGLRQVAGLSVEGVLQWHGRIALFLAWLAGLHVASVLLREIRGRGYEVSAMLHGHRIFGREKGGVVNQADPVNVTVDDILKSRRNSN
jgi:Ni,Fe-hydrogenase I cytochrome b subunit